MGNETQAFLDLFAAVERLRALWEEMKDLRQQRQDLEKQGRAFCGEVIERYRAEEKTLEERQKAAEEENEANRAAVVELTKAQILAETSGADFKETERLDKLKTAVATFPLKLEALDQLRQEVKITKEEQERLSELYGEGYKIGMGIYGKANKIRELVDDLRNRYLLECVGDYDLTLIKRRAGFLPDMYETLNNMRKEAL